MTINVTMKAPNAISAGSKVILHDGSYATVNANGYTTVDSNFTNELQSSGFTQRDSADSTLPSYKFTTRTDTGNATIAASELIAESAILEFIGTIGADKTVTLPTVAALVALIPEFDATLDNHIHMRIINTGPSAFSWVLTTNTGWGTLLGNGPSANIVAVQDYFFRDFILNITSATTGTVQAIGASLNTSA